MKYCEQALAMARSAKRGETRGWASAAATVTALHKHLERCDKCGRDLDGLEWPPR